MTKALRALGKGLWTIFALIGMYAVLATLVLLFGPMVGLNPGPP